MSEQESSESRADGSKSAVQRLVMLRQQAGMSQTELAHMSGVTGSAICMIEAGKREPKLSTAIAIADALHVSVYALIGRTEYLPTEAMVRSELMQVKSKLARIRDISKTAT